MSLGNVESLFNSNSPFCIEISLRTPENQTMILETWCILFNEQLVDSSQKVCYNVYKKMSIVLRSLMCITRSTPTYQLSRRQSSDTYVLLYRMYCGEPIVHHLGENYATTKVGTVGTPIGSILVNLAYRTRLTMTPQNSSHVNEASGGIQIKDDHFIVNVAQRNLDGGGSFRNSPTDLIYNESSSSPKSPSFADKSPRFAGKYIYYIDFDSK
jgi:autophagy-related protein 13